MRNAVIYANYAGRNYVSDVDIKYALMKVMKDEYAVVMKVLKDQGITNL